MESWPTYAAAIRRHHRRITTPDDRALLQAAHLLPLTGGATSAVYTLARDGTPYCLKIYDADAPQAARREWDALQVLRHHNYRRSPAPVHYSPDPALPVVVMTFLPGHHLSGSHLTPAQCAALSGAVAELRTITPATVTQPLLPICLAPSVLIARVTDTAARLARGSLPAPPAAVPARRRLQAWLAGPEPARLARPTPPTFSAGDANLSNFLWDGVHLRVVDFACSGWGDIAYDLADLIEHDQSRGTPDDAWRTVTAACALTAPEHARLAMARRLMALSWLCRFWPRDPSSPLGAKFVAQLGRVTTCFEDP